MHGVIITVLCIVAVIGLVKLVQQIRANLRKAKKFDLVSIFSPEVVSVCF